MKLFKSNLRVFYYEIIFQATNLCLENIVSETMNDS